MNPILPVKYYIPDVEARVWEDGRLYLYGSADKCGGDDYCSREYHVFHTDDLKNWTAEEKVFHIEKAWKADKDELLWAPDCVKIEGKYCMFYCTSRGGEGVAFSDYPQGPFEQAKPIGYVNGTGIDPSVFVDDDGSVYYFWDQIRAKGAKLDTAAWKVIPETIVEGILTEEEHGFHEGASMRKRNGIYYLVYTDISRGRPTCLGYAVSASPLGPFEKKGIIIDNTGCDPMSWNNHGSIEEVNGQWYVFYHRSTHNGYFNRRVCIEPIEFTEDGMIKEVEMTTQGADEPLDALVKLQAYRACRLKGKGYIDDYRDGEEAYEYIANLHKNDMIEFKYLNFKATPSKIRIEASPYCYGSFLEVYLDAPDGEKIAHVQLEETAGKFDFRIYEGSIESKSFSGVHGLYLKFNGCKESITNLKSIQFI